MLDVGWLEKAELKPTQPSLAGAWQYSQDHQIWTEMHQDSRCIINPF